MVCIVAMAHYRNAVSTAVVGLLSVAVTAWATTPPAGTNSGVAIAEARTAPAMARDPEPVPLRVVVLPLLFEHVPRNVVETLDSLLVARLAEDPALAILGHDNVAGPLAAEVLQGLLACADTACLGEIACTVGVDRIFTGNLGRVGTEYILTLRWIDAVYAEPLAIVAENARNEANLLVAARRGVGALLESAAAYDERAREHKRGPTRWTAELSTGFGTRISAEPYNVGLNGAARISWDGQREALGWDLRVIGGVQVSYFAGYTAGVVGRIKYERVHLAPFLELRTTLPIANQRRTRIYLGAGGGIGYEIHGAHQTRGIDIHGDAWAPELRAAGGVLHRWNRGHSAFAGYRFRVQLTGAGVDPISELVQLGASGTAPTNHEVELGWMFHF